MFLDFPLDSFFKFKEALRTVLFNFHIFVNLPVFSCYRFLISSFVVGDGVWHNFSLRAAAKACPVP